VKEFLSRKSLKDSVQASIAFADDPKEMIDDT